MSEKRKPLTKREFGLLIIQQDCKCGCGCGKRLDFTKPKRVIDEHLQPLFSNGSNGLDNRALWDVDCSLAKTIGEAPARAKVRRFERKKTQADKRKERGPTIRQPKISALSKHHQNYRKPTLQGRKFS